MKTHILTGVLLLGLILSLVSSAHIVSAQGPLPGRRWIPLEGKGANGEADLIVGSADATEITLVAQIPGIFAEEVRADGERYTRLTGPGFGFGTEFGLPDIPVLRRHVEVPFGAEVTLEVLETEIVEYALADLGIEQPLYPLQPPVPKSHAAQESPPFVQDATFYSEGGTYPPTPVNIADEYVVRGHRVVVVEFWPLAYNSRDESLQVYTQTRLRLQLAGSDMAKSRALHARYASPVFEERLRHQLLNYALGQDLDAASPTSGGGYLIITADAYEAAITPLATLKSSEGFAVTVTPISSIPGGATTSAVKSYIQNAYDTWPTPPSYVLLVGDTNTIPGWNSVAAGEVTDLYYATMDGSSDWVPDIQRGRFPVRSADQTTDMVDKLIAYTNLNRTEEWLEKIAFIATCDQYTVAEGTHNYAINTYTDPEGYTGSFPNDPQPGGDRLYCITHNAGSADIQSALDDGRWAVIYSGHGSWTGWEMSFGTSNVEALASTGTYPFVASHACITGDFARTEVFGETWVLQEEKGALVFWGSSDSSYWGEDDVLESAMFDALFSVPQPTIGAMTDYGLAAVQAAYSSSARYYWETYNILGDPSITLITDLADFTLDATPLQRDVAVTGVATYTVELEPVSEYNEEVSLSLLGLPANTESAFTPASAVPPFNAELVVTTTASTPHGTHPLTLQGGDALGTLHSTQVGLAVHPRPILSVAREVSPDPVEVGTELVYTITLTNTGGPASGVVVSDVIPADTLFAWAGQGGASEGNAVVWRGLSVPEDGNRTLAYALTVDCVPGGTQIVNQTCKVLATELASPIWGLPITATTQSQGVTADFTVESPVLRRWPTPFTNLSANATTFVWEFGDGGGSTEEEPAYSYTTRGSHEVILEASNLCAGDTATHTLTVEDYELLLSTNSHSQSADPGEDAHFTLWITNSGTLSDTFEITLEEGEWEATVEPASLSLDTGEVATATVTTSVPSSARAGDEETVQVSVEAGADPRLSPASAEVDLSTRANTLHDVRLTAVTPSKRGEPGSTLTYEVRVVNAGNGLNSFAFTRNNSGWPTTVTPSTMDIAAFGIRTIEVEVTIPPTVTLTATDAAIIRVSGTGAVAEIRLTSGLPVVNCYLPLVIRQ